MIQAKPTEQLTHRNQPAELTTRTIHLRAATVDEKQRTVQADFATSAPVTVRDLDTWDLIDEVLLMTGAEIPDRVPLLNNHSRYSMDDVLGSALSAGPSGETVPGTLVFASGDECAERVWNKVKQGHVRDVSAGYRTLEFVDIPAGQTATVSGKQYTAGQRRLRITTRWQLREVSIVPIGADQRTKIREDSNTYGGAPPATLGADTMPMSQQLREFLESLGMRKGLDDQAAWNYYHALTGEQLAQAQQIRGIAPIGAAAGSSAAGSTGAPPAGSTAGSSASEPGRAAGSTAGSSASEPGRAAGSTAGSSAEIQNAIASERARISGLRQLAAQDVPAELVERAISEGWTTERAAPVFLQAVRDARPAPAGPGIHSRSHESDCTLAVLQAAMCLRNGQALDRDWAAQPRSLALLQARRLPEWLRAPVNQDARQRIMDTAHRFADLSLVDVCREAVRLDNRPLASDRGEMIRAAVSGGALSAIFTTNIAAELLGAYADAADSTVGWVDETDVPNFLSHDRVAMGKFGQLQLHTKGGNAKHLDAADSKESSAIARYSGQWVLDEVDIINDRFGALEQMSPADMGFSAASLRPDLVYSILLANASLDADSVALFHATHSNTAATAFSAANMEAAIAAMAKQRIRSRPQNVRPRFLLVPQDLAFSADIALTSAQRFDGSGATTASGVRNPLASLGITLVADDRLGVAGVTDPRTGTAYAGSATNWYLAARPRENGAKTLVVKYLRGTGRAPAIRPFMLTQGQWGIGWDVCHDIGADADDYRGLYRGNS